MPLTSAITRVIKTFISPDQAAPPQIGSSSRASQAAQSTFSSSSSNTTNIQGLPPGSGAAVSVGGALHDSNVPNQSTAEVIQYNLPEINIMSAPCAYVLLGVSSGRPTLDIVHINTIQTENDRVFFSD